jgi:hypothetical protein
MSRIFFDQHDRIQYYGSPAGYLKEDRAVVDPNFRTEELAAFLEDRNLKAEWREGVYDRLMLGQKSGLDPASPILKSCRVWQLQRDSPIELRFIDYGTLLERFGEPDPANYAVVYDGQIETNDLEEVYAMFNIGKRPPGYTGHSMSMSDVVELYDDAGSEFHYCDRMGFQQITFQQQPPEMEMTM